MGTVERFIPSAFSDLAMTEARYKVYYGGRGSGKSHSIARVILGRCLNGHERVFCGREVQKSINDSVHQLFTDLIQRDLKLGDDLAIVQRDRILFPETGSQIAYGGLLGHTIDSVKSRESTTICWIEEAQRVSERSWGLLIPTIRAKGSEIWASFNPDLESDPTYKRFISSTPPDSIIKKVSHRDNPYFNSILRDEMEYLKKTDYESYLHVWEGECRTNSDSQVFKGKYRVESFELPDDATRVRGADWGFSVDPTVLVQCAIHDDRLYIEHEAYKVGVEFEDIARLFSVVPHAEKYVIRADNARPETINYVSRHGYPKITACKKWKGCVEDGIQFMRGAFKEIIIHPRCVHAQEEFRLYSYKVDRLTEEILPDIVDKNNHCIDAIRYALEPLIGQKSATETFIPGFH